MNAVRPAVMVFGLSATADSAILWVYIMPHAKKVWAIPVLENVKPWDQLLLATLSIGIQSLTDVPEYYSCPTSPQPLKEGNLLNYKDGAFNRIFCTSSKDKVLKFFDKESTLYLPNTELMKLAGMEEVYY